MLLMIQPIPLETTAPRDPRLLQTPRSLHLVDMENLAGGTSFGETVAAQISSEYSRVASFGSCDLMVVASSHYTAPAVWFGCPLQARRLPPRSGKNGADTALIDAVLKEDVARFDRVVIGSGDGIFAELAARLQAAGLQVTVVCRPGTLSRRLRLAVRDVRYLEFMTCEVAAMKEVA